jgi:hypothetical protein
MRTISWRLRRLEESFAPQVNERVLSLAELGRTRRRSRAGECGEPAPAFRNRATRSCDPPASARCARGALATLPCVPACATPAGALIGFRPCAYGVFASMSVFELFVFIANLLFLFTHELWRTAARPVGPPELVGNSAPCTNPLARGCFESFPQLGLYLRLPEGQVGRADVSRSFHIR